ncbi:hypothetical protein Tco_0435381 [Tanacetum coccineum]
MDIVRPKASNSPIKRSYFTKPVYRPKDLKPDVKTFRIKNMTTVGTRAVVSKGKVENVLKKANGLEAKDELPGSCGNQEICYRYLQWSIVVALAIMTGNKAYFLDYEEFNWSLWLLESDPKGDELMINLFSVSPMCRQEKTVSFFTELNAYLVSCFKLLDESQVVLRALEKCVYAWILRTLFPSGGYCECWGYIDSYVGVHQEKIKDILRYLLLSTKPLEDKDPVIEQLMARSGMDMKMAKTCYHSHWCYKSLSDDDFPEDNVKIYSNPLFEYDDEYISSDVNSLFNEVLEEIESKDSYVSNLDEPALLVTPLSDANEDECFNPGGVIDEIDAFLDMDISTNIENGYHDSERDIIYLESLLIDNTIPNLHP